MREILTIIGKKKGMKHHYCLDGIDLDNIPYSRTGESIKRLRQCTDRTSLSVLKIRPEFLKANPDKLYYSSSSGHEVFYTWVDGSDDFIIYRIDKLMDNEVWGIGERGDMEYIKRYDPAKKLKEVDKYTNYCAGYEVAEDESAEESADGTVTELA